MKLLQTHMQKIKTGVHATQALALFIAWAITIAVLTGSGSTDGRVGFYFALTWFCIPALLYLVMVPMWTRTRRFANVYAFAAVDMLFALLWFVAFCAITSWLVAGKGHGKEKKKSGCENFKFGSETKCELAEAEIALGVILFLLFGITGAISFQNVMYYKRNGLMPGAGSNDPTLEAQTDAAFSSKPQDDDYEDAGPANRPQGRLDESYAPLHQAEDEAAHPQATPYNYLNDSRPNVTQDFNTGYGGAFGVQNQPGDAFGGQHRPGDAFASDLSLGQEHGGYAGGPIPMPEPRYNL